MKKLVLGVLLANSLMFAYSYKYSYGDSVSYYGYKNNSGWKGVVEDRRDGRYRVKITNVKVNGFLATQLNASVCSGNINLSYSEVGEKIWVPEYCIGYKAEEEDDSSGWKTAGKFILGAYVLGKAVQEYDNSHSSSKKKENTKTDTQGIDPSAGVCTKNGGIFDKSGVCKANWQDAKHICRVAGGRLPTISELKAVFSSCGNKITAPNYKSCCKRKGFDCDDVSAMYWSSDTSADNTNKAWSISFFSASGGYDDKVVYNIVRCVIVGK